MKQSRGAGGQRAAASGEQDAGRRCVSAARGERSDLLRLEEALRSSRSERGATSPATRGGEFAFEAAAGGSHFGQAHVGRGAAKKSLRPSRRRELAGWFMKTFQIPCRRACGLTQFGRANWYVARDQAVLQLRIRELAHSRPGFGYGRIWVLLRREGWIVNRKRVRRLYRLQGLQLRMRVRRRKHCALHRGPAPACRVDLPPSRRATPQHLPGSPRIPCIRIDESRLLLETKRSVE